VDGPGDADGVGEGYRRPVAAEEVAGEFPQAPETLFDFSMPERQHG
jgi:hypothetical protein